MATPIPPNRARTTTWEVAAATGGAVARARGDGALAIGITTDSRAVVPGAAFVALRGETFDGHDFLPEAIAAGATLLVVARGRGRDLPGVDVVEVDDTLVAWGAIARTRLREWRRKSPRGVSVAITGSAGKTTTKEICAALLSTAGPCHKTAGNLNNRIGLPAVALGLDDGHAFAVFEMGMSVPGEIAAMAAIAEPDVAVLVNVGVAHAEGVGGGRAEVAREKGALLEALSRRSTAIVNADDPAAMGQIARTRARTVETFGRAEGASYRLVGRASLGPRGSRVTVMRRGKVTIELDFPLIGDAAALDLLAALAAAEAAHGAPLSPAAVQSALSTSLEVAGRGSLRSLADGTLLLDDTYNANPDSMRAALGALKELASHGKRRAVAVLGEMKELGALAETEHEALGRELVLAGVACVIGCGGLVDLALDRASKDGVLVFRTASTEEAAEVACREVRAGDAVLVKGSRSVGTERVVSALVSARGEGTP